MFNETGETELNYNQTMSGKIGYHNVGFLLHGSGNTEIANGIYSGGDENKSGKYSNWQSWSKLRVYVNTGNKYEIYNNSNLTNIDTFKRNNIFNNNYLIYIEKYIKLSLIFHIILK